MDAREISKVLTDYREGRIDFMAASLALVRMGTGGEGAAKLLKAEDEKIKEMASNPKAIWERIKEKYPECLKLEEQIDAEENYSMGLLTEDEFYGQSIDIATRSFGTDKGGGKYLPL